MKFFQKEPLMSGEVIDTFSPNEYEEIFGSVLENVKVEFCDFQSISRVDSTTKKFLDLDLADFNKDFSADDLISSEKSFSDEEDENVYGKEYQDSSTMEDSGYKTNKQFDSHESHEFSSKFEVLTEMTNSRHVTKRKLSQEDEVVPRKKPKLWKFPSVVAQKKTNTYKSRKYLKTESDNETFEMYVKIFFAHVEKTMIKQEESVMESNIKKLISSARESLRSQEEQSFKCSNMAHLLIEKTFKLLRKNPLRKPLWREFGNYLMQQLCESPVIYKKVIDRLLNKIEIIKNDYKPNVDSMYEQQFLSDLLEIVVSKFSKMDNCSVAENFKEEFYYDYKQKRRLSPNNGVSECDIYF